jgi:hypothetical protein
LHDHDSNILIFINWEVQEIFDEQKTFEFWKNTIIVQINFLEHSIEVCKTRLWLVFSCAKIFQQIQSFSAFQNSVSIGIV